MNPVNDAREQGEGEREKMNPMNDARGTGEGEREKMLENGRSDPGTNGGLRHRVIYPVS